MNVAIFFLAFVGFVLSEIIFIMNKFSEGADGTRLIIRSTEYRVLVLMFGIIVGFLTTLFLARPEDEIGWMFWGGVTNYDALRAVIVGFALPPLIRSSKVKDLTKFRIEDISMRKANFKDIWAWYFGKD